MLKYLVSILLFSSQLSQAADIEIAAEHRVKNWGQPGPGLCWWVSAETAGKHLGIKPLQTIATEVFNDKDGSHGRDGAYPEAVRYWENKLKLFAMHNPYGATPEGVLWLRARIKKDRTPVIFCVSDWPTDPRLGPPPTSPAAGLEYVKRMRQIGVEHADYHFNHSMLLVGISELKDNWAAGDDFTISYIDPNDPLRTWQRPLGWLLRTWLDGRAVSFIAQPMVVSVPVR